VPNLFFSFPTEKRRASFPETTAVVSENDRSRFGKPPQSFLISIGNRPEKHPQE